MEDFGGFLKKAEGKCPYSALAKDGIIEYNGVILFVITKEIRSVWEMYLIQDRF